MAKSSGGGRDIGCVLQTPDDTYFRGTEITRKSFERRHNISKPCLHTLAGPIISMQLYSVDHALAVSIPNAWPYILDDSGTTISICIKPVDEQTRCCLMFTASLCIPIVIFVVHHGRVYDRGLYGVVYSSGDRNRITVYRLDQAKWHKLKVEISSSFTNKFVEFTHKNTFVVPIQPPSLSTLSSVVSSSSSSSSDSGTKFQFQSFSQQPSAVLPYQFSSFATQQSSSSTSGQTAGLGNDYGGWHHPSAPCLTDEDSKFPGVPCSFQYVLRVHHTINCVFNRSVSGIVSSILVDIDAASLVTDSGTTVRISFSSNDMSNIGNDLSYMYSLCVPIRLFTYKREGDNQYAYFNRQLYMICEPVIMGTSVVNLRQINTSRWSTFKTDLAHKFQENANSSLF